MTAKIKRIPKAVGSFARELIEKERQLQLKYAESKNQEDKELYWYHRGRADSMENFAELLEKI